LQHVPPHGYLASDISEPALRRLIALPLAIAFATPVFADEVTIFAAASLKTALDTLATTWESETGHDITISYAGSGALAAQIIAGAPADIFLSAAPDWMDEVAAEGLVTARTDLLGNSLVLVAHGRDAPPVDLAALPALLGDGRLSMAMVNAVPAGQYGRAALETLGLWTALEPSVAQSENVRAALAFVATGEAPFGIVYATDAAATDNVTIVATFPADSHPPILYPVALLTNATDPADRAFFDALSGDAADAIFAAEGFAVLN
jgi:molybdate transport system substrate-binding protein